LFNTFNTLNTYGFFKNVFVLVIDNQNFLFFVSKKHLDTIVEKQNDVYHLVTI